MWYEQFFFSVSEKRTRIYLQVVFLLQQIFLFESELFHSDNFLFLLSGKSVGERFCFCGGRGLPVGSGNSIYAFHGLPCTGHDEDSWTRQALLRARYDATFVSFILRFFCKTQFIMPSCWLLSVVAYSILNLKVKKKKKKGEYQYINGVLFVASVYFFNYHTCTLPNPLQSKKLTR